MNRAVFLIAAVMAGCSTMQSARTLAPGKTQVGVGMTLIDVSGQNSDSQFVGELRVAHGASDGVELGARIARTPGGGAAYSAVGVGAKFQLSHSATSSVALELPIALGWVDMSLHMRQSQTFEAFPTLYLGASLAKDVEGVFASRIGIAFDGDTSRYGYGASLGLRFGDQASGSALHPEVGMFHATDGGYGESGVTFLTIGISVTAGD
jgi:hypothetical protein